MKKAANHFFTFAASRFKHLLKKLQLLLWLSCLSGISMAQTQADSAVSLNRGSFSFSMHTGFIIAHRPALIHLQKRHSRIVELQYLKVADGSKAWHHIYNYPLYGLGYRYIDFGNKKELGQGHAVYSNLLLPLSKSHRYKLNIRFGVGIGYIEKPFDTESNYKNLAIGSNLNGTVLTGLQFRFFTKKKMQLFGGIDFFHFSNGAFALPNLGINLPSINAGICFYKENPVILHGKAPEAEKRHHEFTAATAIGFKEKYPPAGKKYRVHILNIQYHLPLKQKGLTGGGTEFIIDPSLRDRLEADSISSTYLTGNSRIGVFGSIGLRLGKWDALLQPGYYVYSKVKEDGSIYNRLLLKYNFHQHFYASLGLKSHFAKADYFEWGIGYKL